MESEIIDITENYLKSTDYSLIDVLVKGEKKNRIVELFLDSEKPVSLDELADISRDLNKMISENEINSSISKLVVSSPGVDKPFKFYWQLKKHIGRTLEILTTDDEKFEAVLENIDDNGVLTLKKEIKKGKRPAKDDSNESFEMDFSGIKESKVVIKF
jgi:ribosome maturation factor RimP